MKTTHYMLLSMAKFFGELTEVREMAKCECGRCAERKLYTNECLVCGGDIAGNSCEAATYNLSQAKGGLLVEKSVRVADELIDELDKQ